MAYRANRIYMLNAYLFVYSSVVQRVVFVDCRHVR